MKTTMDNELVRLTPMYDEIMTSLYGGSGLLNEDDASDIIETQLLLAFRMGLEEGQEIVKQELEAKWGEY